MGDEVLHLDALHWDEPTCGNENYTHGPHVVPQIVVENGKPVIVGSRHCPGCGPRRKDR